MLDRWQRFGLASGLCWALLLGIESHATPSPTPMAAELGLEVPHLPSEWLASELEDSTFEVSGKAQPGARVLVLDPGRTTQAVASTLADARDGLFSMRVELAERRLEDLSLVVQDRAGRSSLRGALRPGICIRSPLRAVWFGFAEENPTLHRFVPAKGPTTPQACDTSQDGSALTMWCSRRPEASIEGTVRYLLYEYDPAALQDPAGPVIQGYGLVEYRMEGQLLEVGHRRWSDPRDCREIGYAQGVLETFPRSGPLLRPVEGLWSGAPGRSAPQFHFAERAGEGSGLFGAFRFTGEGFGEFYEQEQRPAMAALQGDPRPLQENLRNAFFSPNAYWSWFRFPERMKRPPYFELDPELDGSGNVVGASFDAWGPQDHHPAWFPQLYNPLFGVGSALPGVEPKAQQLGALSRPLYFLTFTVMPSPLWLSNGLQTRWKTRLHRIGWCSEGPCGGSKSAAAGARGLHKADARAADPRTRNFPHPWERRGMGLAFDSFTKDRVWYFHGTARGIWSVRPSDPAGSARPWTYSKPLGRPETSGGLVDPRSGELYTATVETEARLAEHIVRWRRDGEVLVPVAFWETVPGVFGEGCTGAADGVGRVFDVAMDPRVPGRVHAVGLGANRVYELDLSDVSGGLERPSRCRVTAVHEAPPPIQQVSGIEYDPCNAGFWLSDLVSDALVLTPDLRRVGLSLQGRGGIHSGVSAVPKGDGTLVVWALSDPATNTTEVFETGTRSCAALEPEGAATPTARPSDIPTPARPSETPGTWAPSPTDRPTYTPTPTPTPKPTSTPTPTAGPLLCDTERIVCWNETLKANPCQGFPWPDEKLALSPEVLRKLSKVRVQLSSAGGQPSVVFEGGVLEVDLRQGEGIEATGLVLPLCYVEPVAASSPVRLRIVKVEAEGDPWLEAGIEGSELEVSVFQAQLEQVSFGGAHFYDVQQDDGTGPYPEPHWQDNSSPLDGDAEDPGDRRFPVSYTRNSLMEISARLRLVPAPAAGSGVKVRGDGPGALDVWETDGIPLGEVVQILDVEASGPFDDAIGFLNPLGIEWSASPDGGRTWCEAGRSENRVYVTLAEPNEPKRLYETVLDIGGRNAVGSSEPDSAVAAIWADFAGPIPGVKRKAVDGYNRPDGVEMRYWKPRIGVCQEMAEMLQDRLGNGSCRAWAQLFETVVGAQGIPGVQIWQVLPSDPTGLPGQKPARGHGMLIRKWDFVGTGTAPGHCGPFTHTEREIIDQTGVPGQANQNPPGGFENHFINEYARAYYDPSYGTGPFRGATDLEARLSWENAGIEGYTKECWPWRLVARRNDPTVQEVKFSPAKGPRP